MCRPDLVPSGPLWSLIGCLTSGIGALNLTLSGPPGWNHSGGSLSAGSHGLPEGKLRDAQYVDDFVFCQFRLSGVFGARLHKARAHLDLFGP